MKEKCYALRTSILILILGGIFTSILYFIDVEDSFSKIKDFSIMILGGATSSAVATSIIYCTEYNVAKRSTLEQYYISATKVLNQFSKLKYFHTYEPIELIMEYFTEKQHNDDAITLCMEMIEDRAEEYLRNMNSTIDLYIKLAETSYSEMDSVYGGICYFTSKKYKEQIYNDIHEPLIAKLLDIKGTASIHFKGYRNGEMDNKAAMLYFLTKLQDKIYRVDFKEDEEYVHTIVYKEFYNTITEKLEKFRAEIYGTEPEYKEEQFCCYYSARKVDGISKINNQTIL